jgi:hypothetical protein
MPDGGPAPVLTVVVAGDRPAAVQATVADAVRAAAAVPAPVEVLVVWTGAQAAPPLPEAAEPVEVFPLGTAYASNRGLEQAAAPLATFLEAGRRLAPGGLVARLASQGGRAARGDTFDVAALRRAGGFDHAVRRGVVREAALRLAGPRRASSLARRLLVRGDDGAPSDPALLRHAPEEIRSKLTAVVPLAASLRSKTHWMYDVGPDGDGPDRVLHLYARPSPRLLRAVGEREQVRLGSSTGGVPRLHAAVPARDCLWVLEDRVPGRRPAGDPARWFGQVSEWVVGLGGPPGPPLRGSPHWTDSRDQAVAAVPAPFRATAARAVETVEALPSRAMHGDLQPKNVLVSGDRTGAVDWEGVWLHGVPGLDLLYLALFARDDAPDPAVLPALLSGQELAATPVLAPLSRLGVRREQLPSLVLTCLAVWTLGEARRTARLGAPVGRAVTGGFFSGSWSRLEREGLLQG